MSLCAFGGPAFAGRTAEREGLSPDKCGSLPSRPPGGRASDDRGGIDSAPEARMLRDGVPYGPVRNYERR